MRLDKRVDWGGMAERAERHFKRRAALNNTPRERMAAHPRGDYCKQLDNLQAIANYHIRRSYGDNTLGPARAAAMRSRREHNHDR